MPNKFSIYTMIKRPLPILHFSFDLSLVIIDNITIRFGYHHELVFKTFEICITVITMNRFLVLYLLVINNDFDTGIYLS